MRRAPCACHTLPARRPIYYRDADAALLVYDITDVDSFTRVKNWVKELRRMAGKDIVLVLAGNKTDMERNRQVTNEDAEAYAASVDAQLIGTSAKVNRGVEQAFLNIAKRLIARKAAAPRGTGGSSGRGRGGGFIVVDEKPKTAKQQECC